MSHVALVLGMHRSGTSALAGCLAGVGVEMGRDLMPGREGDNPSGFFEHPDLVEIHDRWLAEHGSSWDDPLPHLGRQWPRQATQMLVERIEKVVDRDYPESPFLGFKDPRLCRLSPVWQSFLESRDHHPLHLLLVRNPREVVASLAFRNRFSPRKSVLLWLDHCLSAERDTRGLPRVVLTFDEILQDPVAAMDRAGDALEVKWPTDPDSIADDLTAFVDPKLLHHRAEKQTQEAGALGDLADSLWQEISGSLPPGQETFDKYAEQFLQLSPTLDPVHGEHLGQIMTRQVQEMDWRASVRCHENADELREELAETQSSLENVRLAEETRIAELARELANQSSELVNQAAELTDFGTELSNQGGELTKQGSRLNETIAGNAEAAQRLEEAIRRVERLAAEHEQALKWLSARLAAIEDPSNSLVERFRARLGRLRASDKTGG